MKPSEFILDAHGIDLQIARGETIGLLGLNGMGKSTLIRALLGHVTQCNGQINFFDQGASRAWARPIFPTGAACPNLSVRENLVMAARRGHDGRNNLPYKQARARHLSAP